MKEKLLGIIREKPGLRKRTIFWLANCPIIEGIKALDEMKREGLIRSVYHSDPANMEFYDEWYVKEG